MEEFTNPEFSFVNESNPSDLVPRNSKYFEKDLKEAYESECKYNQTLLAEIGKIKDKEKELIAKNEKDNKDLENLKDEVTNHLIIFFFFNSLNIFHFHKIIFFDN